MEKVFTLDELPVGTAKAVQLGGEPICVVRVADDTAKAIHDTCSHQEYSLSEGWVEENAIECALHGSTFNLDTGEPETLPAVKAVPVYACQIRDEAIWVDQEDQRNRAPVPRH